MSRWFRNGEPLEALPIDDRAFHYGDGLFETIAIRDGEARLWNRHLQRLARGCEVLRMQMPDAEVLHAMLDGAFRRVRPVAGDATVKLLLSAGRSSRGYARPVPADPDVYVGVFAAAPLSKQDYCEGVDTIICDTRLAVNSVTAGCKTLNRIEQVLARSECLQKGVYEGFTLDADGRLICGTMSNVFIVADDLISTPSLDRCGVEGVMRQHAIAGLRDSGRNVSVRDVAESELLSASEVFLSNSQFGIVPVKRCGDKKWDAHPVTRDVMGILASSGIRECQL